MIHCTTLYLDVCAKGYQAIVYSLGSGAHMLALLQDIMEVLGGSATELPPSTNSPQDEAQVLHEQPSEDATVLQGDSLPKARVCDAQYDWISAVSACASAFTAAAAHAYCLCLCLCSFIVPVAFCQQPLNVASILCLWPTAFAGHWCLLPKIAGSWQRLLHFSYLYKVKCDADTLGPSACYDNVPI